jgi:hypothetical protein
MLVDAKNVAAHEMTPVQLTAFIEHLEDGSNDK